MKKILFRIIWLLGIHHLLRFLLRRKTVILFCHGFTDKETLDGPENYDGKHLSIPKFRARLAYLKERYQILSLPDWLDRRQKGEKIPDRAVILTFDDGYRSNYTLAYPVLKEMDVPATIFLTTDFVQNGRYLWTDRVEYALSDPARAKSEIKKRPQQEADQAVAAMEAQSGRKLSNATDVPDIYRPLEWREILEMLESGLVTFGSHTHTHKIVSRLSPAGALEELRLSREMIEHKTLTSCDLFCYPNGEKGDFNEATKEWLKKTGYRCALTTVEGFNDETTDPFELRRSGISNREGHVEFVMALCGVKKWISDTKRRLFRN